MPSQEAKLVRENPRSSINVEDFPSNSQTSKKTEPTTEKKKLDPVTKARIRNAQKKKGWLSKVGSSIFSDDSQSVGDYILFDVLVPAIKSTLSEIIIGGVDLILFGERRHRPDGIRRDGARSYHVPYGSYYNGPERDLPSRNDRLPFDQRTNRPMPRDRYAFETIVFPTRGDAENVLAAMVDAIHEYQLVTIADFYDLCDLPSEYTDNRYGWTNLDSAYSDRGKDGYYLRFPRPQPI